MTNASTQVQIRLKPEDLAMLEWLMADLDRKRSDTLRWALRKVAKDKGYVSPKLGRGREKAGEKPNK